MQILKDIYKLAGEEFRMIPNIYAIKNGDALVLIDCGTDQRDWDVVQENMEYWGLDNLRVTHVLITHAHMDHAGYAYELQRKGAKIIAGACATALENMCDPRNFYYAFGRPFTAFKPDIYVRDGEEIDAAGLRFEVIEAAGHSAADVVYKLQMNEKIILFIGDVFHIAEYGSGAWIGEEWFLDSDYDAYMRSLYKLKDLKADVILSGHMQGCLRGADAILRDAFIKAQEKFDGKWDKKIFMKSLNL